MPEFEGELDKLTETAKENKSLSPFSKLMCKLLSKDEQENAFMKLVLIQVSRNRDMKLKLYPQLANVFILPIIMVLPQDYRGKRIYRLYRKSQTRKMGTCSALFYRTDFCIYIYDYRTD